MTRVKKSPGIDLVIACALWRDALPNARALARRVHEAAAARNSALGGSIALLLADDAALRDLNHRFRGKDNPTNVLSFPSGEKAPGFLGDIALAYETCRHEAAAEGKAFADHAAHLIAHGLLHLVGFDHETDAQALVMEAEEVEILAALAIASPYSES